MCSIFGWQGKVDIADKMHIIANAKQRGRDGWGFHTDTGEIRGFNELLPEERRIIFETHKLLGNFRATPTTEAESTERNLQPYDGIVHNGIIANDTEFGNFEIDSMVLPEIIRTKEPIIDRLKKIKGSFALAWYEQGELILATNYKPIYFKVVHKGIMFASTPEMISGFSLAVPPYSYAKVGYNNKIKIKPIPREQNNKVVVSCSGGLDSVTVAYILKSEGYKVELVHFLYGCNAETKEVERVKEIAKHGHFKLKLIPMPNVMKGTITEGTYHKDGVEGTEYAMDWVSGRNLLMLSILTAYAESNEISYIAFGGNLEESGAYPDNEQEFGRKFNEVLPYATQNGTKITLLQPLSIYMKHEIVKIGVPLGVPYHLTWSCYSGNEEHCGECGPCFMRRTAFERNELDDPVFE